VSESDSGVIVVADDDADILDLVSLTLERAGHVVHRARDGEEALGLVRSDPDTSAVRIVLLTARVQERDTDAGIAAGAHEYIRKPFSPQDLQERIAALLRQGSA
jgi:DNA-binding response OmpR family regulator